MKLNKHNQWVRAFRARRPQGMPRPVWLSFCKLLKDLHYLKRAEDDDSKQVEASE